jgi:hypothetical protein
LPAEFPADFLMGIICRVSLTSRESALTILSAGPGTPRHFMIYDLLNRIGEG